MGWHSLHLELRQFILLEVLKASMPCDHAKEALLCTLKRHIKVSYTTGQTDLMQPLRVMTDRIKITLAELSTARLRMKTETRQMIVQEGIPVGPLWDNPAHWPFCRWSSRPVCGPHTHVSRMYCNLVTAFRKLLGCRAVLSKVIRRLHQMRSNRACSRVIPDEDSVAKN